MFQYPSAGPFYFPFLKYAFQKLMKCLIFLSYIDIWEKLTIVFKQNDHSNCKCEILINLYFKTAVIMCCGGLDHHLQFQSDFCSILNNFYPLKFVIDCYNSYFYCIVLYKMYLLNSLFFHDMRKSIRKGMNGYFF